MNGKGVTIVAYANQEPNGAVSRFVNDRCSRITIGSKGAAIEAENADDIRKHELGCMMAVENHAHVREWGQSTTLDRLQPSGTTWRRVCVRSRWHLDAACGSRSPR